MLLVNCFLNNVIVHKHHKHFDEPHEAFRSFIFRTLVFIPTRTIKKDDQQESNYNPQL